MTILGVNYIYHDSSACLVKDGKLSFAIEEERLTRDKHTQAFPTKSIGACLSNTGTELSDINHIAISVNPNRWNCEKLGYAAKLGAEANKFLEYEFQRVQNRNLAFWRWYHSAWPDGANHRPEVHFIDHHKCHAVGSYFVSPWEEAALLSIDGWGEWSTTWLGEARGSKITAFGESLFPHSLGVFYSAATEFCGFKPNYDEGKTMGLAPTGDPDRYVDVVSEMAHVDDEGVVHIDTSWFDFPSMSGRLCGGRLIDALGPMRGKNEELQEHHRDVAAAFQYVLENCILKITKLLARRTKLPYLVSSGGVALNSVANGRILREGHFEDIYVMPGAGDNGTAIGAAAYVYSQVLGHSSRLLHLDPYLGDEFSNDEIRDVLDSAKVPYRQSSDICAETAELLHDRKIVGWFQGRMEFGPRALGGRSILANPTCPDMKSKLNAEVKHREAFRPFAPSVIAERASEYFDLGVRDPFMLKVCSVRPEMRSSIPAVVHVDGTARLQTVEKSVNLRYHQLISQFGARSGHPVVLNTSFNVMNEPIVATPQDALRCYFSTGIDALVIGDFVLTKN